MKLERIRELAQQHPGGGVKGLAREAGISEATIHRCINNQRIQAGDLERIAKILGVSVVTFFDESEMFPKQLDTLSLQRMSERIKSMETMLAEMERLIEELMKK